MMVVVRIFSRLVGSLIGILQILMLVRAILSWFPIDEDSTLNRFVISVTEPIIVPVRIFLDRFEFVRNMPIDISFMVAYLLLIVIQMLLPVI